MDTTQDALDTLESTTAANFTHDQLEGYEYNGAYGAIMLAYDTIVRIMEPNKHFSDDGQFCWVTKNGIDVRLETHDHMESCSDWYMYAWAVDENGNDVGEHETDVFKSLQLRTGSPQVIKDREPRVGFNVTDNGKVDYLPASANIELTLSIIKTFVLLVRIVTSETTDPQGIAERYAEAQKDRNRGIKRKR